MYGRLASSKTGRNKPGEFLSLSIKESQTSIKQRTTITTHNANRYDNFRNLSFASAENERFPSAGPFNCRYSDREMPDVPDYPELVPKSAPEARGIDFCADKDYYYIIRSDLGVYMR